jgi:RNA polymerase sigma factor (TIGR02999 family)
LQKGPLTQWFERKGAVHPLKLQLPMASGSEPDPDERQARAEYAELCALAVAKLAREVVRTLEPPELVVEAWLRLGADHQPAWQGHHHFFAAAAEAMRRILIDQARRRRAARRGGGRLDLPMEAVEFEVREEGKNERWLALDEALDRLAQVDAGAANLVQLHCFEGLPVREAARVLGISESTGWRTWRRTRSWLHRELNE